MGDAGYFRFPGSLDPRAEEFRPRYPYSLNQMTFFPPQIYYPYPSYEAQAMPFCDGAVGVGFPQFATPPPAYVSPSGAPQPLPPRLLPPSTAPTRTLLLSSVPTDVSESEVRRELEVFGDVRAVQMEKVRDGIVTVHFYDLRHAQAAMGEIREQHMQQQSRLRMHFDALLAPNCGYQLRSMSMPPPHPPPAPGLVAGRAVWAHFTMPMNSSVPEGHNQGTLVIFNLHPEVSTTSVKGIFEAFGPVKELRETPMKPHQRFVEFYDVRDAAKALAAMNGREIHGAHLVIEFSRPGGGHGRRCSKSAQNSFKNFNSAANYSSTNPQEQLPPPPHFSSPRSQSNAKKPIVSRANSIGNNDGVEECNSTRSSSKKNPKTNKSGSIRPSKGRQAKNLDPRFLINEDAIMEETDSRDSRTTVMIKNIPNKYSQKLLLNMLDNHCIHCNEQIADRRGGDDDDDEQPFSSYDFVYLPIDFINKCNVGYGFVNMTSPQATWRLYKAFHRQNWEVFNSKKICEVTYARLQGVEALKDHFKNSKFPCETEEYLPVAFSPPRDGRQLTEPSPIVGRSAASSSQSPPAASSNNSTTADDDDDGSEATDGWEERPQKSGGVDLEVNMAIMCLNDYDDEDGRRSSSSSRSRPNGGDDTEDDVIGKY